jgi:uncharacterized protein YcaQ
MEYILCQNKVQKMYFFPGRIEFEKHRQNEALLLKGLWLEKDNHEIQEYLKDALNRFSKYLGANDILNHKF